MIGTGVYYEGKLEAWFKDRAAARNFAQGFPAEVEKFVELKPTEIVESTKDGGIKS